VTDASGNRQVGSVAVEVNGVEEPAALLQADPFSQASSVTNWAFASPFHHDMLLL
jgi:hypothetical protein